jgi:prevent-host-death family protein
MKIMSTSTARETFRKTIDLVRQGERVLLIRNSKPVAALVPIQDYERLEKAKK